MTGEVKELLGLFPWFQSAHLLLLKGLHNTEDVKFESQLKQSAIYLADREVLYYLLHKPVKQEKLPEQKIIAETTLQQESPDISQVVIESGKSSADIIQKMEAGYVPEPAHEDGKPAGVRSIEPEIITSESQTDESASIVFIIDDGEIHNEETVVFMDPSISTYESQDLLEIEESEIEIGGTSGPEEPVPSVKKDPWLSRKELQSDLIEKFILANPRIEPSRERIDKPQEDISKPFTEARSAFVTETLAKIYISQGYYSKAIDIYEKLCLKYPEKSSYFASQIEKVRSLIK
jgi:hypothetical protein